MSYTVTDRRISAILGPHGETLPSLTPSAAYGSFQGADYSRDRGFVWLPTADSKKEVDATSCAELRKKSRVLYNSGGGLFQRAINGVARMVTGTGLDPYPLTKNRDWNRRLKALWNKYACSKNTFDLARRFNARSVQPAILISKLRDGDCAPVLARNEDNRLRMAFYEAGSIGGSGKASEGWCNGVKCGPHNEALAFEITGPDLNDKPGQSTTVPAEHVLFCADHRRFGSVRGLPRLTPVINQCFDWGEIGAAITKNIKVTQQTAYVIEQQMQSAGAQPIPGEHGSLLPPRAVREVDLGNGRKVNLEEFLNGGESWAMQPGQTFKLIESANPHENVVGHRSELVRSIAWDMGYAPEILWNIIELGGANMRFIQSDAQREIDVEQERLIEDFLGPFYIAWVMDMMEGDFIEDPGDDWMAHGWIPDQRLSVDIGDAKMHIEKHKRGMITLKSLYGMCGDEWQIEIDQYLDERQYIKSGLTSNGRNLTWEEAYPELKQGPFQPDATADPEDNTDSPKKNP
jgi:capsid protein